MGTTTPKDFAVGQRVYHPNFGWGTVLEVVGNRFVQVSFDRAGPKKIDPSGGHLSISGPEEEARWRERDEKGYEATFAETDPHEAHVHGSHWAVVTDDPMEFVQRIPEIVQESRAVTGLAEGMRPPALHMPADEPVGANLVWPVPRQGVIIALKVATADEETNELLGLYPWVSEGTQHRVALEKVHPWNGRVEAQIAGVIGDLPIVFFDAHYATNKMYYRAGWDYEFILMGFAYSCEVADPQPITVAVPDRVRELRRLAGQDESDLSPVQFQTKGMAALFPIDGWDRDDYSFQGPVKKVDEREFLGRKVWKLRVTVMRQLSDDADLDLDIYVADRFFLDSPPPRVGDDVRGALWLQGYLWMVPWESRGVGRAPPTP